MHRSKIAAVTARASVRITLAARGEGRRLIRWIGGIGLVVCLATVTPASAAPPTYQIIDIGLTGAEHTRDDGYKDSLSQHLNEAGQVIGYSMRYNGGSTQLGRSAWLFDGSTTQNVGFSGAEHTRDDGFQFSEPQQLNEAGQVMGFTDRYNGGSTTLGRSAWLYDGSTTLIIGLLDTEHTRSDGYRLTWADSLNEAGQVIGRSERYIGIVGYGRSAWLFDGSTTWNIGLVGAEHTRDDGYKYSEPQQLNEAGQVIGSSIIYDGGSYYYGIGQSAWLYDGATTLNIGLVDAEHSSGGGSRYSESKQLTNAGQVIGTSQRYSGIGGYGQSAWLYNGSTTLIIGLVDAEHTSVYEDKYSEPQQLNEAGHVIGTSQRYDANFTFGQSAWLYNGSTTLNIGLLDAEHTRNDGRKYSDPVQLNNAGQVIGYSERYNGGSTTLGLSAWLYDGSTTLNIGLSGAEHTRNDGYQSSGAWQLNEAGQVIGSSIRYNGGSVTLGNSAWLYDGSTTLNIGLTGAEHTRNDGYQYSGAWQLNEAGQVIGSSNRYNGGSTALGQSAWLYDGSTTLNIGLVSAEHSRDDGTKGSTAQQLNEAGQVIGYSVRFYGDAYLGQDAWVYDPVLGTIPLQLSVRDDGYAYSSAQFLGADGVTLGLYSLYDGMTTVGTRAFYWSASDGLWDLGALVDGGLSANGWEHLARGMRANGLGYISGYGLAAGLPPGSRSEFLMVPVPEPGSRLLACLGVACLMALVVGRPATQHHWRRNPFTLRGATNQCNS
ncbi:MAG: DUF3466 family protein [Pirellulales bacterium]|nr:DUF3466 family protein [Pirellulales bacterium]